MCVPAVISTNDTSHVPPAQIVNQNAARCLLAMAEFNGRSGGFVQQAKDEKSSAPKCVYCQESLVAVRISRNAQHHFQDFRFTKARKQRLAQCRHQSRHQLRQRDLRTAEIQLCLRTCVF